MTTFASGAVSGTFAFMNRVYPALAAVFLFRFAAAIGAFRFLLVGADEFFENFAAFTALKFYKRHDYLFFLPAIYLIIAPAAIAPSDAAVTICRKFFFRASPTAKIPSASVAMFSSVIA